jgi:hypothetical protein
LSIRCLSLALFIDPACVEAADALAREGFLSATEKKKIFDKLHFGNNRGFLEKYFRFDIVITWG